MNAQHDATRNARPATGRGYLNAVLTANAVLLAVLGLNGLGLTGGFASTAKAQASATEDTGSLISAAEQRKQIIVELRGMAQRLDKIDATLAKGVNVNVKNFPSSFGKDTGSQDAGSKPDVTKAPEIKRVDRPAPRTGNVVPK